MPNTEQDAVKVRIISRRSKNFGQIGTLIKRGSIYSQVEVGGKVITVCTSNIQKMY